MSDAPVVSQGMLAVVGIGSAVGGGFVLKLLSDWLDKGKEFVTRKECNHKQKACPQNIQLKQEFIQHKTFVTGVLRQHTSILNEIKSNGKQTNSSISKINTAIAVLASAQKNSKGA